MTAGVRLGRAIAHGWAVLLGYPWRQCAACGNSFGGQEQPRTEHLETIPGGEDDHRLLCPTCVDDGVGCRAHADTERPLHHDGCEHVPDEIWPADDTDTVPGRSGPYLMVMSPHEKPTPYPRPRKETLKPMEIRLLPEPAVVEKLAGRAAQRRIRAAGERARVLAAHRDMLAGIPDVDNNAALLELLRDHAPVIVESEDRLVCRGCQPSEPLTEDKVDPVRLADGPCPTWSTIRAHYEKRTA
ncbi:hypothetical protein [Amycolatopsis sp. cmx-4-83]|uniref:hypothetical protein n=1 Tax=Amycolatopsis sp. cmx-4-83 TaxID=2790940 RepID=UPI00397E792B